MIVVGAGGAGLAAACVAAAEGASVLLLEQSGQVGGTTAISGGMVWIPANHKADACGRADSLADAQTYLSHTVPGEPSARLASYLRHGDEALRYLEQHTTLRLQPVVTYPDYYPDLPGATLGGRVLEPVPFDGRELGDAFPLLRDPLPEFTLFGGMMISRQDIPHLRRAARNWRSALHVARLLAAYGKQRLRAHRGTTLYLGNALSARLLHSALALRVSIRTRASVEQLQRGPGRSWLVETLGADGTRATLQARRGLVLASGGISHDAALRSNYVPAAAGALSATVAPGGAPRGACLAQQVGARLSAPGTEGAFWVPASTFTRRDGSSGVFPHTVTDRAKPGLIAVGGDGRRFVNEAVSYHEFVRAQLRGGGAAVPAWLLCDRRFLWKYGLGRVRPFALSVRAEVADGYLKQASTLEDLARQLGVPPPALAQTVAEYNRHARRGEDPAFGRGSNAYQRHLGDGDHAPNPCVAPLEQAPFHAVAVWPADLGMSAGIQTDDHARVLGENGPMAGLYACGNDMASVMEGAYPGPGITLGPALTFAWLAGRDAAACT